MSEVKHSRKKVYLETYGCQMNEYDSELICTILAKADYQLVTDQKEAGVVMLNTCSVREHANDKVYNRVHRIRQEAGERGVVIGVLGCMATNFKKDLLENRNLGIDFVAGPDSYKQLPSLIAGVTETGEKSFHVTLSEFETYSDVLPTRKEGVGAWIAVMRGCNNFCTFCVVPFTRGRERSRAPDNIVHEVRDLVSKGYRQVTLLGQNVNSYQFEESDFAGLLQAVSTVPGIERIRFTSPHPKDFPESLLKVIAENPKVSKHIHLPLQAGSNRILDLMHRTYTREEYLQLVQDIRKLIPDVALTTDIIVGFPSESEPEFQKTLKVMQEVRFDAAFIFKYSPRKGTTASRKHPDDIPDKVKSNRCVILNDFQKETSLALNQSRIGCIETVLIEEEFTKKSQDDFQGRTDSNKIVILPQGPYRRGDLCQVKITGASANVLHGTPVDKEVLLHGVC